MIARILQRGPVVWLLANWQLVLGIAGAFALWSTALYLIGRDHGYEARVSEQAAARAAAEKLEDKSAARAAQAREADKAKIADDEESRNEAITGARQAGAAPSASRIAGNCERMRQAGADISLIPACRGRATGEQTRPGP